MVSVQIGNSSSNRCDAHYSLYMLTVCLSCQFTTFKMFESADCEKVSETESADSSKKSAHFTV